MPYFIELGSGGHSFGKGRGIVTNSKTGHKFSKSPIPLANAEKQKRLLEAIGHGYNKDGKERWAPKS